MAEPTESDFKDVAALALRGDRRGALAALAATLTVLVTGHPLAGVAAGSFVTRVSEFVLSNATRRFESAGCMLEAEQEQLKTFRGHLAAVVVPLLEVLQGELSGQMTEQFLQTARQINSSTDEVLRAITDAVTTLRAATVKTEESTQVDRMLEVFRMAFDRPAFRNSFANESSHEHFIDAVRDTARTLNTGVLFDRETKQELQRAAAGYGAVKNAEQRKQLEAVVLLLGQIRRTYEVALSQGKFRHFEYEDHVYQPDWDRAVSNEIDDLTIDALVAMNAALEGAGHAPLSTSLTRDRHRCR